MPSIIWCSFFDFPVSPPHENQALSYTFGESFVGEHALPRPSWWESYNAMSTESASSVISSGGRCCWICCS